ncbi:Oidioi.mRNA.OKI2018_I69.PAR.g12491.t1.cds [Oikopleura dioica]|uniref:Carbohydrate sulfotransferase n=1 Tax=Oikopleura dioica TaxID=34765 RepID=A0ABN7S0W4_OIKDI|nr:Oidioi.mRNA.OKI2018_I69.PAR.g12491.t1.cds [Oikopleura dioica]
MVNKIESKPVSTFREDVIKNFESYYDSEIEIEDEYEEENLSNIYENGESRESGNEESAKKPTDEELKATFEHRKQTPAVRLVEDPFNILICLPPKCGTTNWQRGMNTLNSIIDGKKREPETFYPPKLYSLLPVLTTKQIDSNKTKPLRWERKVANTRNPFARLFSAWNDKSRNHLDEHGEISFDDFSGSRILQLVEEGNISEAKKRMRGIIADKTNHFHAPYWAGIKPFQTSRPPAGRNSSFEAFAEYIVANPGNSKMNHHWRTLYGQCAPCAVEYEYIIHLEESLYETPYLLKRLGVNEQTHVPGKYSWSPAGREEMKWSSVPRLTAEKIYQHYYADFVLFGYSPDEVLGFIDATRSDLKAASVAQRDQSRANLFPMRKSYLSKYYEGCQN